MNSHAVQISIAGVVVDMVHDPITNNYISKKSPVLHLKAS